MTVPNHTPDDLREPPPSTGRASTIGLIGVGLVFAAFVMGLVTGAPLQGFDKHWADGPRALLCVFGLVVAGCAISMRPSWYPTWLCGAGAALLGYGIGSPWSPSGTEWYLAPPRNWYAGMPNSWDSVQLFFGVAVVACLIGAVWTLLPRKAVYSLILLGAAFHFAGILSAVTSPPPTPWLTDQYWKRVARPYLQFAYMNNAYQFYSPDPGPACQLWICVDYRALQPGEDPNSPVDAAEFKELQIGEDPDTARDCTWFYIPEREVHYVDPLGLNYFRRLSITENVATLLPPGRVSSQTEQEKVLQRRANVTQYIPRISPADLSERRVPNELITNQILPSYVRHMAHVYAKPGKVVKTIRVYRTQHSIISLADFRGYDTINHRDAPPKSPYNAGLYLPFFQGKFTRDGRLIDPTDPMLYWLVPILQERSRDVPLDREEYKKNGGYDYYFTDYVSRHAGCARPIKE